MSLCDGRDHLIGQNMDRLKCERCGRDMGAAIRPNGEDSLFLQQAIIAAQADANGYRKAIEARLVTGRSEYGEFQYLNADCEQEAIEESLDIGAWLALSDHKLEIDVEAGRISPVDAARVRHLRLTATAHAIRAYAALNRAREIL